MTVEEEVRAAVLKVFASDELKHLIDAHCNERLAALGIDWKSPEGMRDFLEDQLYLRTWRKSVQKATRVTWVTALTVIVTGALGALWLGVSTMLGHPQP